MLTRRHGVPTDKSGWFSCHLDVSVAWCWHPLPPEKKKKSQAPPLHFQSDEQDLHIHPGDSGLSIYRSAQLTVASEELGSCPIVGTLPVQLDTGLQAPDTAHMTSSNEEA